MKVKPKSNDYNQCTSQGDIASIQQTCILQAPDALNVQSFWATRILQEESGLCFQCFTSILQEESGLCFQCFTSILEEMGGTLGPAHKLMIGKIIGRKCLCRLWTPETAIIVLDTIPLA